MTPNMVACGSLLQGTSETEEEESQEEQIEDQEEFEENVEERGAEERRWKSEEAYETGVDMTRREKEARRA